MTSRDRGIVLGLVALLVALTFAIGAPAFGPAASPNPASGSPGDGASGSPGQVIGYREGIVGRPESINPLTARSQADRDLVALIYSGLVRLGPDGTVVPDLASRWIVAAKGTRYVFTIRSDAVWQDGQPVTAADVVYTISALKDPAYDGPGASSWREVDVSAVDAHTVRFDLTTPLGGFLLAATQPLLPDHLLHDVPAAALALDPFNEAPIGSGPFRLVSWDATQAHLVRVAPLDVTPSASPSSGPSVPAATASPRPSVTPRASAKPGASASPSAAASPTPTPAPTIPPGSSALSTMDLHFYSAPAPLIADYQAGQLDAAVGLSPADAQSLAAATASRLLGYPRTTFTGIVLNLRPGHTSLQDQRLRMALLQAVDRPSLIADLLSGSGRRADTPIPPSSWAFDRSAAPEVGYDPTAAAAALRKAGWKKGTDGWVAPGATKPFRIQMVAPDKASNPTVNAVALAVAADWKAFGFAVSLLSLTPRDFVDKHLAVGLFDAAAVDVNVGLDPDLYPFYASTQTTSGGANVSGIQVLALDQKLQAARVYASRIARMAAFKALQVYLGQAEFTLPLFFRTEPIVLRDRVWGPTPREISDPGGRYWDVLTWRLADGH